MHVDGGEEAGLRWVGVDPSHRIQAPTVLGLEDLLLSQRLDCIAGALLLWNDEGRNPEDPLIGVKLACQNSAALHVAFCVIACIAAKGECLSRNFQVLKPGQLIGSGCAILIPTPQSDGRVTHSETAVRSVCAYKVERSTKMYAEIMVHRLHPNLAKSRYSCAGFENS